MDDWHFGAGAQVTLNIKATILSKGSIVNDAEISSPSEDPTKLGNNKSSVTINAIELADLSLTKTVSNATPIVNDEIVYTIVVSNAGHMQEPMLKSKMYFLQALALFLVLH
jgi:hypothetical protein